MSKPRIMRRADPKPCPTCYAPMRPTVDGFECVKHGAPPHAVIAASERPYKETRPYKERIKRPRTPRAARPSRPRQPSEQTERLTAMQETIVARNTAGESIATIAHDLWQELGYTNAYVCASKISHFFKRRGIEPAAVKPGPPPGTRPLSHFSEERLAEVRSALSAGTTVWAFAGLHWQAWGFRSRSSCDSLIRKWLRTHLNAQDAA